MRIPGRGAPSIAYLVVGLGNPGNRYAATRHNIGLRTVEEVAARLGGSWRARWHGRVCETRDGDERLALLAPETFMNESGRSVAPALRFYKLPPERLLVVHDELDLPLGDIRAKSGGGLAGHNGLRSVVQSIGTQDFLRVRIGIGQGVAGRAVAGEHDLAGRRRYLAAARSRRAGRGRRRRRCRGRRAAAGAAARGDHQHDRRQCEHGDRRSDVQSISHDARSVTRGARPSRILAGGDDSAEARAGSLVELPHGGVDAVADDRERAVRTALYEVVLVCVR